MKTSKVDLKKKIKHFNKIIASKCLDCVCYQPKEVLRCEIASCPLWTSRPKELRGLYILVKDLKRKNNDIYEAKK